VGAEEARARAHVASCEACARFFAQDRGLLDALERLRQVRAPLEVRERIFRSLAEARAGGIPGVEPEGRTRARWTPWVAGFATAAAVAASVVATLATRVSPVASDTNVAVAQDYLRRTVGEDYLDTSDPHEVSRFIERELGLILSPLTADGLSVERVEICLLDGKRGAMILYRVRDEKVSHYVVPAGGAGTRAPTVARERAGTGGEALPMVTWSASDVNQALVGAVSPDELLALARRATGH
jgi:hypothetical protein